MLALRDALTALGRSLSADIAPLRDWAYAHMDDIEAARRRFDDNAQVHPAAAT